ncbi:MAG: nucleotidyl transferase AbiEii/AbiGii toxin family protein [Fibrobacter sp.]|nr:nucleotidyl transferase AbiEii/AbiGii toxin family protein [Fibrobacter sp.]
MASVIDSMLAKYDCKNVSDYRNALKEIVQEVALCGLSRGGFFDKVAFYGGTALRIFYGLDRFSEDMDFSMIKPDEEFELSRYFGVLEEELNSVGLEMTVEGKHILKIVPTKHTPLLIPNNEILKIKFEVDTNPPELAAYESKYRLLPSPFMVRLYDKPSLFAGKLHALLCRGWKNRVKGRDFYDFVWYISQNTGVNLPHLQKRMEQTGHWKSAETLTFAKLKELLNERFTSVDFDEAKRDVRPFIADSDKLSLWSKEFFCAITEEWNVG